MTDRAHSEKSTLREHIVEHVFVGDVLRALWRRGIFDVEVLRSEFDAYGYDLAIARGKVIRHIQFKTGKSRRPGNISLSKALAAKPSGCVIWIRVTDDLDMGPYFFFGNAPGMALPPIEIYPHPLRSTHRSDGVRPERLNHHSVPGSEFQKLDKLEDLLDVLFGMLRNDSTRL
jgi:hypothetical protein